MSKQQESCESRTKDVWVLDEMFYVPWLPPDDQEYLRAWLRTDTGRALLAKYGVTPQPDGRNPAASPIRKTRLPEMLHDTKRD